MISGLIRIQRYMCSRMFTVNGESDICCRKGVIGIDQLRMKCSIDSIEEQVGYNLSMHRN